MNANESSFGSTPPAGGQHARKIVFISYRYGDKPNFDQVRQIASRLRFFSFDVILDQRTLAFGEDIRDFMVDAVHRADAMIVLLTQDYNDALTRADGTGEGVRFEARIALQEKGARPNFQIIPVLLEQVRPAPPFDRLKCAGLDDIDEVITQLGLISSVRGSRVIVQRYRIDLLIEQRGMANIFRGWDTVMDQPVEILLIPPAHHELKYRINLFERIVRGRAMAFSPFLLNFKDTHIDGDGAYYLITERFDGTDLEVFLAKGTRAQPAGAFLLVYQACLALHELHAVGVVHAGLAPRTIRLNSAQTRCKIVDFEFARPLEHKGADSGTIEGYPLINPPERFLGAPVAVAQNVYQIGNLLFRLLTGMPVVSTEWKRVLGGGLGKDFPEAASVFWLEGSDLEGRLCQCLEARLLTPQGNRSHPWLLEMTDKLVSKSFLRRSLVPFLHHCLCPDPGGRLVSCLEVANALAKWGVPPTGNVRAEKPSLEYTIFEK